MLENLAEQSVSKSGNDTGEPPPSAIQEIFCCDGKLVFGVVDAVALQEKTTTLRVLRVHLPECHNKI